MTETTKERLKKADNILTNVLLVFMACLLVFSLYMVYNFRKTGEEAFVFGYRPIFVTTGSMEPYIKTNGMALTRKVTSMDQLEIGDVISYTAQNDDGSNVRVTHRIVSIDDGYITTKGDNNKVEDSFKLTLDNVQSEVVFVCNFSAWLIETWQSASGKILLVSIVAGTALLWFSIKIYRTSKE